MHISKKLILPACAFSLVSWMSQAHATIVAQYDFDSSSLASADSDTDSIATDIILFDAANGVSGAQGGPAPSAFLRGSTTGADEASAVSGDDYLSFTITPEAGISLSFTSLTFDARATGSTTGGGEINSSWFLRSSSDSFAATIDSVQQVAWAGTGAAGAFSAESITISGLDNITTATEFRLYLFDDNDATNAINRIDNITLNATVTVIPEPSTFAALGVLIPALGLIAYRRRKQQS